MIVGLFLRNIKTYQGINYIPISDKEKFCGLVGANGIGKSSVLEALDSFFNGKPWNYNTIVKKSGYKTTLPHIVPVFLIKKHEISEKIHGKVEVINHAARSFVRTNATNISLIKAAESYISHREKLKRNLDLSDFYMLPIGLDRNLNISFSIFNSYISTDKGSSNDSDSTRNALSTEEINDFTDVLEELKGIISYIYIPREIDPETFTKLETDEIQVLMGETLHQVLNREVPDSKIREINTSLNSFIGNLSDELDIYSYRTPGVRQQNLRKADLYQLIIQAFFNIRKLHKKQGENWLEISQLSSGEKQKAIIDVAHSFLKNHRRNGENLIVAIDEPESSLHMSSCYDQFDALYNISKDCRQVVITTHWYGFFPTIDSGNATIITEKDAEHRFDIINLSAYREEVKQASTTTKGKLPYDIRLKSTNDLIQSIITSAIGDTPFNWIICEGSSEKIYFEKYFEDLKDTRRLRIVPVGGAKEVRRIYNHLSTAYLDFKSEVSGKIILVSDTDFSLVDYQVADYPNLLCKRIVNDENNKKTILVNVHSNPKSPKTEIEDTLNGKLFHETLLNVKGDKYPDLDFLDNITPADQGCVYFSLDVRRTESQAINNFFSHGNNKFIFANKYAELMTEEHETPEWILEIRSWLISDRNIKC